MPASHKHQFEVHHWEDPLLPFIMHIGTHLSQDDPDLSNFHDGLELLYVTEGCGTLFTGGTAHDMTPGTLLTVAAGEVHRFETACGVSYHCLIVGSDFCKENGFDPAAIRYVPSVRDAEIDERLTAVLQAFSEPVGAPHRVIAIRCAVLHLLLCLNRRFSLPCPASAGGTDAVRVGLDYIHCHFTEAITLEDITTHARVSKYHFLRRFKQSTGCTVIAYVQQLRCRRASELLLNTDERIATVARLCGFDSPSYFTKTFARLIGMRPAEYRARHAEGHSQK